MGRGDSYQVEDQLSGLEFLESLHMQLLLFALLVPEGEGEGRREGEVEGEGGDRG